MQVYPMCAWCPWKSGEGVIALNHDVTDGCKQSCGCWELSPHSLQQQSVPLRAEPSFQSLWVPLSLSFPLFHSPSSVLSSLVGKELVSPLSPLVPVTRVYGQLQVCVSFRRSNVELSTFPQPLPSWEDIWDLSWREAGSAHSPFLSIPVFFSSFWKCLYPSTCKPFTCLFELSLRGFSSFCCYCTFIVLLTFFSNHLLVHKCNQCLDIGFMSFQLCWVC